MALVFTVGNVSYRCSLVDLVTRYLHTHTVSADRRCLNWFVCLRETDMTFILRGKLRHLAVSQPAMIDTVEEVKARGKTGLYWHLQSSVNFRGRISQDGQAYD